MGIIEENKDEWCDDCHSYTHKSGNPCLTMEKKMQVIKLEVIIIDMDGLGAEEIKSVIENQRYPNHCISPYVRKMDVREIGEWSDKHPMNYLDKRESELVRLFGHNV